MIIALLKDVERFQFLIDELDRQKHPVLIFQSTSDLQRWLEVNSEPRGLIIDFINTDFQDFLIRFSLRCPEVPVLSLKVQAKEQLFLRLLTFCSRIIRSNKSDSQNRILLVDDSRTVQMQYGKILRQNGFVVEVADDAFQGFEKALASKFDLAIIDYFMPGETGASLVKRLQAHEDSYELVCAILTAQYKEDVVNECIKAGAAECIFKNESYDLFLTRVRSLIRGVKRKRQIEKERSRLIGLLNSVAEGVYGVTPDGRIQFVNPATLKMLGQSMAELMGHYPHDCIHPIDNGGQRTDFEHCFLQQAYLLGDELREWRTLFQRADGSLFPVECSVTTLGRDDHIEGSVVVFRDISEQQRLEKNWQWQLSHDQLTGLLNRGAFEEILSREINRIARTKDKALLLFIDLDKFKLVNDNLGHAAGDQLLLNLAESLKSNARDYDYVGRLAGDEFVVLLTHIQGSDTAELAERYRMLLENETLFWEGENHQVTGSIGVTELSHRPITTGEALIQADEACQKAKQSGRNQWAIADRKEAENLEQGNWFERLTSAMKSRQFVLLEQGIFDSQNPELRLGNNCLLRLQEGESLISPALFMSDAKRFGVIQKIDQLVIKTLCQHLIGTPSAQDLWYAVTFSVDSMSEASLLDGLLDEWLKAGFKPARLRVEVGEEELFSFPRWKNHLARIRQRGFGVVISHFGMNSQSVLNLPQLPVDAIKLDTSLTRELATSLPRCNLIDAIVKTAKQAEIQVIATHIETYSELDLLQARGVDLVQGYYLDKPSLLYVDSGL